jgi:hypothetical protein
MCNAWHIPCSDEVMPFDILMPAVAVEAVRARKPAKPAKPLDGAWVLVVDDENIRRLASRALARNGIKINAAARSGGNTRSQIAPPEAKI